MANEIVDLLIAGRKQIEKPEKWIKGDFKRVDCFCAQGALLEACGWDSDIFDWANEALEAAIPLDAVAEYAGNKVAMYNDDKTTTHADVLALFDKAIEAELAKVAD